jgi:hypothetical protein
MEACRFESTYRWFGSRHPVSQQRDVLLVTCVSYRILYQHERPYRHNQSVLSTVLRVRKRAARLVFEVRKGVLALTGLTGR